MNFNEQDGRQLVVCAFRYALGRMSYVTADVARMIKEHWEELSPSDQKLIHREINEALEMDRAGMSCDQAIWRQVLDLSCGE